MAMKIKVLFELEDQDTGEKTGTEFCERCVLKEDLVDIVQSFEKNIFDDWEQVVRQLEDITPGSDPASDSELYRLSETKNITNGSQDVVDNKIKEINSRRLSDDGWRPYMMLKEIIGVDLINQPDVNIASLPPGVTLKKPTKIEDVWSEQGVSRYAPVSKIRSEVLRLNKEQEELRKDICDAFSWEEEE